MACLAVENDLQASCRIAPDLPPGNFAVVSDTYFIDTVFNYPTLAECYKAAAFNGINRLARAAD